MTDGDSLVPKWGFLALLLIFLLFGEAPAGDSTVPDSAVSATNTISDTHHLSVGLLADHPQISSKQSNHE